MTDTGQRESTPKEESQASGFRFPFGNCAELIEKMQEFCGGSEGYYSCCATAEQTCCGTSEEAAKQ